MKFKIKTIEEMIPGDIAHIVGKGEHAASAKLVISRLISGDTINRHQYMYLYLGNKYFFYPNKMKVEKLSYTTWISLIDYKNI